MPGVFSGLAEAPAYNTVTSEDQQDAAATGNESGPSGAGARPTMAPMSKILAAVMRSAAAVQGQQQAKTVAKSQQAGAAKMTVTLKQSPDGGSPLATVKDVPIDLLNGTQAADVAKAYNTPKEQVERKLGAAGMGGSATPAAQTVQAPTTPQPDDHPLEQAAAAIDASRGGHIPRPWEVNPESLKSEDGIRALAEADGLPDARGIARDTWRKLQRGQISPAVVIQNIANMRLHKIEAESQHLENTLAPQRAEKNAANLEANRQRDDELARQRLSDAERKQILTEKQAVIDKTDWSLIPPSEWDKTAESMNTTGISFSPFELSRVRIKAQQDIAKAFNDFKGNPEKYALGTYPSWEAAKTAFGHPLSAEQDKQGAAAWKAAHTYAVRKANDDTAQQALREARLKRIQQQIEIATKEKPAVIGRGDVSLMSAFELTSMDPSTVKDYDSLLEQKEGFLRNELRDQNDRKRKAYKQKVAIEDRAKKEGMQHGDEEQLGGYDSDYRSAMARASDATEELQAIQQKRAERRGGPSVALPAAPTVPYRPVNNAKYTTEVEAGIAAYMRAAKVGRAKAIEQLRAAGRLR